MDIDKIKKQNYLRKEIIEQNYDPEEFSEWMETQKNNGKSSKLAYF